MFYRFSENIDEYYKKMSRRARVWAAIAIVAIVLLLLLATGFAFYYRYQHNKMIAEYEKLLEKSHQNYYLQGIANSNLEKKLQELMLELATLKNNTIEMEMVLMELKGENADLNEIRRRMEQGISKTKIQLENMQSSVNSIIEHRKNEMRQFVKDEYIIKKDSLGKHARYPER
ncbi:MAG: hypothetical protein MJZ66_01320 [Bacteroidales bacterium]|nr:hypothetical protein [Bacteroidales bacterium]